MKINFPWNSPPKPNHIMHDTDGTLIRNTIEPEKVDKSDYCGIVVPCDPVISLGCKAVAYPMLAPTSYRPPETVCATCICWDCKRKNCSIDTNLKAGMHLPKFNHRANPNVCVELRDTSENIPT